MANYAGLELHEACAAGDTDAVEECIKSGIDVNTKDSDWNDRTPLHWACMKCHGDIVELLLENEADPNLTMDNGWSPLHSAAETGSAAILRALVRGGADVFKQDRYGDNPRRIAEIHGNRDCAKYLYDVERQICEGIFRKAEAERQAAEAAAAESAAAAAAAASRTKRTGLGAVDASETGAGGGGGGSGVDVSSKVVTLVEGGDAAWRAGGGPTGPILKRGTSSSGGGGGGSGSGKQATRRSNKK